MRPAEGGGGGGTDFSGMSHQQMLAWLDEASSFYVGDAARKLKSVATQLEKISKELKASMEGMDWEGEAEKAFAEWTINVANTTSKLALYSKNGAVPMDDNSAAIAAAQSAMPRYTSHASAKENLAAARKYHNDPDSQYIAGQARSQMADSEDPAVIKAKEEANRQAAADEMRRLSSTYQWSSYRMSNEVPPVFPPPPGAFVPDAVDDRGGSNRNITSLPQGERHSTSNDTETTTHTTRPQQDTRTTPDDNVVRPTDDPTRPTHVVRPEVRPDTPVDLGIDSVDTHTLPPTQTTGPTTPTPGGPPPVNKPDFGTPPFVTTGVPPFTGKNGPGPVGPTGPVTGGTRNPLSNGGPRGLPGMPGATREGISGGRQVPHTGRPSTGIPRSTVVGAEQGRNGTGMGRGPMGGGGMGTPMGGGQSGISGGRRLAGETGGVVGGKAQRAGTTGTGGRPFTPGGSGLVRGNTARADEREEQNGERPDYLVEDEETWQQGRRVAPPVID
ncbi:hypothetical protein DEJ44_12455 [Streptomyces venezuelae]|uniref:hypothetical protein n=1 Tax=Streptomyces venezuelae TaxID=54571 RepID=UPI0012395ED7|nr:hypothetical protein [Streptomyces venezuelae]QES06357.1 hypothetical protein DEJ44_12455 [Streptomyces venezuelae]